jgi:hypothetical protein
MKKKILTDCHRYNINRIFFPVLFSFQANGEASLGKYVAGSVVGAGAGASLFVANHAY